MTPDEVFTLTKQCLNPADPVDAIYFQGAVLDPIKVLEKIETELGLTVSPATPRCSGMCCQNSGLPIR